MAKFAQYCFIFKDEFGGSHEWEKRQEHFGALFKEDDSVEFSIGDGKDKKVYKHKVYHLSVNQNIIVMRFANDKDLPTEIDFEPSIAKHEPSCFVIIDNRDSMRSIAIQNRREAFTTTSTVANILEKNLTKLLHTQYCYTIKISPDYYPEDLFQAWTSLQEHIAAVRFGVPEMSEDEIRQKVQLLKAKGKDYYDDSLMGPILQLAYEAKKDNYKQIVTISPEEKKAALFLDKNSVYIRNLVSLSAAADMPVELVTIDGASFQCFVDVSSENVDKIINREFDASLLEMLFHTKNKKGEDITVEQRNTIEEQIVEFVNGMKHDSKDEKKIA